MTMVEKVEAALRAQLAKHGSGDIVADMARAAIEAMREPAEEMLQAGAVRMVTPVRKDYCAGIPLIYGAMIDAALADEKADQAASTA